MSSISVDVLKMRRLLPFFGLRASKVGILTAFQQIWFCADKCQYNYVIARIFCRPVVKHGLQGTMVRERITKRVVDAVKPSARDVFVWDQQLHGFGLKVTPKGRKVFLAQYRLGGRAGRTQRVTLGSFGTITVDQARQQARHVLGQSATGHDPAGERAAKAVVLVCPDDDADRGRAAPRRRGEPGGDEAEGRRDTAAAASSARDT